MLGQMFQCLNNLIVYGQDILPKSVESINIVITLSLSSLATQNEKCSEADKAEGATLLQQILLQYGSILNDQQVQLIVEGVISQLNQNVKYPFYTARLLGIIILALSFKYEFTLQLLNSKGILGILIEKMLTDIKIYSSQYDSKVFIIGFTQILLQRIVPNEIQQSVVKIFDFILTLLNTQFDKETKNNNRENVDSDFDDSDDDY